MRELGSTVEANGRTRRAVLASGGAALAGGLAGCLGDDTGTVTGGTGGAGGAEEPEPPWTTEELADYVDDDTTVTLYASLGEVEVWEQLIEVINDEFGTGLELEAFVSDGGEISQRIIQERQADRDQADLMSQPSDLINMVHENGSEEAERWFEHGVDENFWFSVDEEYPDRYVHSWFATAFNGGPSSAMPINPEVFEERGLDRPSSYNDLFDDQYEGIEVLLPGYLVASQIGWIVGYHANQLGIEPQEWVERLLDHVEFRGADSHTSAARAVAEGRSPLMFYNFNNTLTQFIPEHTIEAVFVDGVWDQMNNDHLSINREAPNPWAARYVLSATVEKSVQRRLIHDVGDQLVPGRTDIDYSDEEPDEFLHSRLTADITPVSFSDEREYIRLGEQARSEWIDY
ncbi:transporter [Halorubrum sp. DTA98]|uniref:transporter n=1 Tax=Halorubrum sp. DTA98 TaxID=3402163 RepID=UPI003AAFCEC4